MTNSQKIDAVPTAPTLTPNVPFSSIHAKSSSFPCFSARKRCADGEKPSKPRKAMPTISASFLMTTAPRQGRAYSLQPEPLRSKSLRCHESVGISVPQAIVPRFPSELESEEPIVSDQRACISEEWAGTAMKID